ncbi:MAG: hypothetical protein A3F90_02370 [Deltaproteobacteria bacterium RIFCSPLOWO2_12_FULL_60_19]|nr:MAG: hypothetical protein A3F90_02370 [Deltaproteobacteria bacterium RIFCSPLOWO2_12_FULL_60_19]
MAQELTVVGKAVAGIDAAERVTGRATYTADVQIPRALYAKMLRCPHPHARVKSIDVAKAQALPGVKAVLTPKDIPSAPLAPAHGSRRALTDYVTLAGEAVAAVAAVTPEIAAEALKLIQVDYETLPFVIDAEEALKTTAAKLEKEGNLIGGRPTVFTRGDVEKGFAEADKIVEANYTTPFGTGNPLEPRAVTAQWSQGRLTLWLASQGPFLAQRELARYLGMPENRIRVISTYVGGGFGNKYSTHPEDAVTALLARKSGQPVKFQMSRAEDMVLGHVRGAASFHVKAGAKRDGTMTALSVRRIVNQGAHGAGAAGGAVQARGLYNVPNLRIETLQVRTNAPDYGPVRGVMDPYENFAVESTIDELAEAIEMNPLVLRIKNIYKSGDPLDGGVTLSSSGLDECIRKGADRIGWGRRKPAGAQTGAKKIGVGMAVTTRTGGSDTATAVVKVNADGSVNLFCGATDIGTGSRTTLTQIAAEELGVRYEDISITTSDTETTPYSRGSWGSGVILAAGKAVQLAAADARRKLIQVAAQPLQAKPEDLVVAGGAIFVKDFPEKKITIGQAAARAGYTVIGSGTAHQTNRPTVARGFAAHFAEVEVDTDTGQVRVLRLIAAHDVGRAIHPKVVENQIEGGVIQGIALALTEELIFNRATGRSVNTNFVDFKVPTIKETPLIEVILVEPGDPLGAFGAKGSGETPIQAPAAAIANAVYNATGKRPRELPMTPRRILTLL